MLLFCCLVLVFCGASLGFCFTMLWCQKDIGAANDDVLEIIDFYEQKLKKWDDVSSIKEN